MQAVSNEFKELAKSNARISLAKFVIKDSNTEIDGETIIDGFIEEMTCENTSLVGNVMAKNLETSIYNNFTNDFIGKEIYAYTGQRLEDGTEEYVPRGTFIIDESEEDVSSGALKLKGLDYTIKFNKAWEDPLDWENNTYTLGEFAKAVCDFCGLELETEEFTNSDYVLTEQPAFEGYQCRYVMQRIAEIATSNVFISPEDKVQIRLAPQNYVSAEGSSITLEESANSRLKIDKFEGEITQETTKGYQLLKNTNVNSGDGNYWTTTTSVFDETARTITITTNQTRETVVEHKINGIKSNQTYTMSAYAKSNGKVTSMEFLCYNSSIQGIKSKSFTNLTTEFQKYTWTFTTASDIDYLTGSTIRVDNNGTKESGVDATLIVKDVMLEEGSTAHDYEDFTNGSSPNPDYPQSINVVSGDNTIDICGKNLFDNILDSSIATARTTITYDNGQIVMNTTGADAYFGNIVNTGGNWVESRGQLINVQPNTTYTFSITNNAIDKNFITYYDENKVSIRVDFNVPSQRTFTTPANAKYVSFRIGITNSTSGGVYKFNVMLEKGSTAITYEPFNGKNYEINLGKNLFNLQTWVNNPINYHGATGTIENNTIYIDNSAGVDAYTSTGVITRDNLPSGQRMYAIELKPNTKYTLSFIASFVGSPRLNSCYYSLIDKDYNCISFSNMGYMTPNVKHKVTITTTSNTKYLTFRLGADTAVSEITYSEIQLEKGEYTSYSPYFTPIELGKIGDYKDKIFKGKGINLFDGIVEQGTINAKVGWTYETAKTSSTTRIRSVSLIPLDKTKTYTLTCFNGYNYAIQAFNDNQLLYIVDGTTNTWVSSKTFTNIPYIAIMIRKSDNSAITTSDISKCGVMLIEGTTALPYEPYGAKGKWYLHKEIGKVVFNGTETGWGMSAWGTRPYKRMSRDLADIKQVPDSEFTQIYSNEFRAGKYNDGSLNTITSRGSIHQLNLWQDVATTNLNAWLTWLASNNLIVYYQLDTPTNTEITKDNYPELYSQLKAIEKARTLEGLTYIDSSVPISFEYDQKVSETIDINSIMSLEVEDTSYKPYNAVTLALADGIEGENVTLRDETSIALYGERALVITANEFAINQAVREELIKEMFNSINGFNYVPMKLEYNSYDWLERYDRIKVQYDDDKYYETYLFNHTTEFPSTIKSVIEDVAISENKIKYEFVPETQQKNVHTEIVVDKLNGTISEVVSTQEEFEDSLSQLTITVDGIQSKVELNYDFVRETSGNNYVSVDDIQQEGLLELKITGTAISEGYLRLHITNNVPEYIELPISTILKQGNIADELSIENIYNEETELYELHCFIDKKLDYINNQIVTHSSSNNYLLASDSNSLRTESGEELLLEDYVEGKQDLGIISIPIQEGQHTFSIENFNNLSYYLKYAVLNNITSEFALKKHIVSEINQSAEEIQINADKISMKGKTIEMTSDNININSDNFKVDSEGNMICNNANVNGTINSNNGNIAGWEMTTEGLTNGAVKIMNNGGTTIYTIADLIILRGHLNRTTGFEIPDTLKSRYDLNGDGQLTLADLVLLQNLLKINIK